MIFESDCLLNVSVSDNLVKNYLQCTIEHPWIINEILHPWSYWSLCENFQGQFDGEKCSGSNDKDLLDEPK